MNRASGHKTVGVRITGFAFGEGMEREPAVVVMPSMIEYAPDRIDFIPGT